MHRRTALAVTAVMMLAVPSEGVAQERVTLRILTGSQGGVLVGLAASLSKHVPGYAATTASVTPYSQITQLKDVGRGAADLSNCSTDLVFDAVRSRGPFRDGAIDLRALAAFYPSHVQLVTLADSGIAKLADLKGKRVSTGVAAGAVELIVTRIFDAAGLDIDRDIRRERLVITEAVQALGEGRIDAFFNTGYRSPLLSDPATFPGKRIRLIDTSETVEVINRRYGSIYAKGILPAGTYPGQDASLPTLEVWTLLCAGRTVSEQVAYNIVKTLFEQKAEFVAAYPDAADITLATQAAVKLPIPFHVGALKYFAENGVRIGMGAWRQLGRPGN
jgi:TRAP transporter TAXI family solute receptor